MEIGFTEAKFTRTNPHDYFDLVLGVEASTTIEVGGEVVFYEPMFAIVEFRAALAKWLATKPSQDFNFESLESTEPDLVWIRRQQSGLWIVGSPWFPDALKQEIPWPELFNACERFIGDVDTWVFNNLKVGVREVVSGP